MNNFGKDRDLSRFTYSPNVPGIVTGNPVIDMILSMLIGGPGVNPVPGQGQGIYDAYMQRERSRTFLKFMQQGFGQSMVMQKMGGLNTQGSLGSILSMMAGQPDGIMDSKILRAFNGGNPVKALMGLNANMTGQTMGMAFGSNTNASEGEVKALFQAAQNQLYEQRRISTDDIAKVRGVSSKELMKKISGDPNTEKFFSEFIATGKDGTKSFDFQKFKGKAKEYAEKVRESADSAIIEAYDEALSRSENVSSIEKQLGRGIANRVNAKAMRGFQLDDLTKTATMAMDLGMLYDPETRFDQGASSSTKKAGVLGEKYFANAGRVLRSVADMTGAGDAQTAMGELNSMLGNSAVNLGDEKQSIEVENLMRRFKGAAKAAGVSIEAVMGILNTTKALASQHSSLQYQGGMATMETTIKSINAATAMASTMGPDWVRRNGGTLGLQNSVTQTLAENKDEPIVKSMASWASAINQSSRLTPEQKEAALAMLSSSAKDMNTFTPAGFDRLNEKMANILGVSKTQALGIAESRIGQQAGMEFLAERQRMGKDLGLEEAASTMSVTEFVNAASIAIEDDGFDARWSDGSPMSKDQRIQSFMDDIGRGERLQTSAQKYGLDRSPLLNEWLGGETTESQRFIRNLEMNAARRNPEYQRAYAVQQSLTNQYAKESARMAEKMAKLQSPFMDTLVQEFVSGNFGGGIDKISDIFMTDASRQRTTSILESVKTLSSEKTSDAFMNTFMELRGGMGVSDAQLEKNLDAAYITDPATRERIKKQRGAMSKEGMDNLSSVSKKLTMSQILQAAKSWKGSKAEQLGMTKKDVLAAAKFLGDTGLSDTNIIKNYGNQKFTDVLDKIPMGEALSETARIAGADLIKDIETTGDRQFEDYMAALQERKDGESDEAHTAKQKTRQEILDALNTFGLVKDGDIDTAGAMKAIRDGGALGGMSVDEIIAGAKANSLGNVEDSLVDKGIASRDKSGNLVVDRSKLEEQAKKDAAAKLLSREKILADGAEGVNQAMSEAEKGKKAAQSELQTELLKGIKEALGTSAQGIASALSETNNILRTFSGGG